MIKTTIDLNGKTLDVKLTLGAIEDFCDEIGVTKGWEAAISESPKNIQVVHIPSCQAQRCNGRRLEATAIVRTQ